MYLTITRESVSGKYVLVWEFLFKPGALLNDVYHLELISYTKYRKTKPPEEHRIVGRWALGWNSTIPWTDVRVPADVISEVRDKLVARIQYMKVTAGNRLVPVDYGKQQQEEPEEQAVVEVTDPPSTQGVVHLSAKSTVTAPPKATMKE